MVLQYDESIQQSLLNTSKHTWSLKERICIVIPTLNEEKNIGDVLYLLNNLGYYNVVVIDGNSKDNTRDIATKWGAKVVLQTGRGKGNAIRQVMNSLHPDFDALVIIDADGSMDPKEIPNFIECLSSGADVVKGSRFMKSGFTYDMTPTRRFGNLLMISTVNLLWAGRFTDLCYGYMAFSKSAVQKICMLLESENFEIETELFIKSLELGLVVKEVPSTEYPRKFGKSNLSTFRDGYMIFRKIFQEFLSSKLP